MKKENVNSMPAVRKVNPASMKGQIQKFEKLYPKPIKVYDDEMVGELNIMFHIEEAKEGIQYLLGKVKDKRVKDDFEELARLLDEAIEIAYSTC
jgi:hypothetical protein